MRRSFGFTLSIFLFTMWGCHEPQPVMFTDCRDLLVHCAPKTTSCASDEGVIRTVCGDAIHVFEEQPFSTLRKDLDVLFVMDNAASMAAKQRALLDSIPPFLAKLEASQINYHVGITTSDVGTNVAKDSPWMIGSPQCDTYSGDDGLLQAIPCSSRAGLSAEATAACASLCPDAKFIPTDNRRFISRVDGVSNVPTSLRTDPTTGAVQDEGPLRALRCMGFVGDSGCGATSPLEASKRALDGHRTENAGFLRANSQLLVIYLADEEDCSVPLAQRSLLNPLVRDCDPAKPDAPDCYQVDFRCFSQSVTCNESLLVPGLKTNCKERTNTALESIQKYARFFGLLRPPSKLFMSGIWPKPSVADGGKVDLVHSGGTTSADLDLSTGASAACISADTPRLFGRAQLRLSRFAELFGKDGEGTPFFSEASICEPADYLRPLDRVQKLLTPPAQVACLLSQPALDSMGQPLCVVIESDANSATRNPLNDRALPVCSSSCCSSWKTASTNIAEDPNVRAACASEAEECSCAVTTASAGPCAGGVAAGVYRKQGLSSVAKRLLFRCAGR